MGLQVVDGDERNAGRKGDRLGGHQPDDEAAGKAGAGSRGNAVEIGHGEAGLVQSGKGEAVEMADMGAGGDLGDHAAIKPMFGNLRKQLIGQDKSATVRVAADNGCGRLVARGFKAEHGRSAWGHVARTLLSA
jgi:hypothetical protein